MNRDEAEEFTEALAQIHAGGWRLSMQAWTLGVPTALGMTHEAWVTEKLGGYVRLSVPDRREAVAELAASGLPNTQIADILGIGEATVRRDRSPNGEPPPEFLRNDAGGVDADSSFGESDEALTAALGEIEEAPTVVRARLNHRFSRGVAALSGDVLLLDPEAVAAAIPPARYPELRLFRDRVDRWFDAFERAAGRGVRLVK